MASVLLVCSCGDRRHDDAIRLGVYGGARGPTNPRDEQSLARMLNQKETRLVNSANFYRTTTTPNVEPWSGLAGILPTVTGQFESSRQSIESRWAPGVVGAVLDR